jgi:hypothetical protein
MHLRTEVPAPWQSGRPCRRQKRTFMALQLPLPGSRKELVSMQTDGSNADEKEFIIAGQSRLVYLGHHRVVRIANTFCFP